MNVADLDLVFAWRNRESVRAAMFSDQLISREEHAAWFAGLAGVEPVPVHIFMQQDRPAGVATVSRVHQPSRRCSWGFYLGAEGLPAGSGKRLGFTALEYLVEELGMRKICAAVLASNRASLGLHRFLGFREEGHLVAHHRRGEAFEDVVLLAIFDAEWRSRRGVVAPALFTGGDD
jgi:UDP-4-amino-4,6-dideoxy-N-acetyl-beta-L-altrosamine N-acetyltransferase